MLIILIQLCFTLFYVIPLLKAEKLLSDNQYAISIKQGAAYK